MEGKAKNPQQHHYKKVNLDSFDSLVVNGSGNAGDCEDSSKVAIVILAAFGYGRHSHGGKWRSALLNSVKEVLDNHVIFGVGATVTSAYVDNNNKPVEIKSENMDLPMIGDEMDLKSHCDGHCFAVMMPIAVVDRLLANGNLRNDQLAHLRKGWGTRFPKREYTVPMMVLEGTGSVEPTVLPIDEMFNGKEREVQKLQAHTVIAVMHNLKSRLVEGNKEVADMFNGEGLEFYTSVQHEKRRVSRFYREFIHGVPIKLYASMPTLSQIAFCKNVGDGYEYGVNTGELLRAGVSGSRNIALITPFKDTLNEWMEKVVPLTETVQNQMPIMAFGHYDKESGYYSRFLPQSKNGEGGLSLTLAQRELESLLESTCGNPQLALVRLQSREWKLTDPVKLQRLNQFLGATPGLKGYGYYSEKHIPNCDALIDILLVVETSVYK